MKRRALRKRYGRAVISEREVHRRALEVGLNTIGENSDTLRDLAQDNREALRKIMRSYRWFLKHPQPKNAR